MHFGRASRGRHHAIRKCRARSPRISGSATGALVKEQGKEDFGPCVQEGESFGMEHDDCDYSVGGTVELWLADSASASYTTNSSRHISNNLAQLSVIKMTNKLVMSRKFMAVVPSIYSPFRLRTNNL